LSCPFTIPEIKQHLGVAEGDVVAVTGGIVTGVNKDASKGGFFLQDTTVTVPDYSGIFVFLPATTVAVGDRVDVTSATVKTYFGEVELTGATLAAVTVHGDTPPTPVVALSSEIGTGGAKAAALEGVVVRVVSSTVTNPNPTPASGDTPPTNEFEVDGAVRVDDFLFLTNPLPALNDKYASISGVLAFRYSNSKIEPRSAADLVVAPVLAGITPSTGFIREGTQGQTIPVPMVVSLVRSVPIPTDVTVTSDDPADLDVVGQKVTIPANTLSAPITFNALHAVAAANVTATLGGVSAPAAVVRVLGAADLPTALTVTPAKLKVAVGEPVVVTISVDIPAPAGGLAVPLTLTPFDGGTLDNGMVAIAQDALSTTVTFTAGVTEQPVTIGATSGTLTPGSAVVTISGGLGVLAALQPIQSFARVGVQGPSFPDPIVVALAQAVFVPTTVTVTSGNPIALGVLGGGTVTVPAGQLTAPVPLDPLVANAAVTLTATQGTTTSNSVTVRVLDVAEAPTVVILSPATGQVNAGQSLLLTATLDIPGVTGGTTVALSGATGCAGTVPASVVVSENQLAGTFNFVAGGAPGSCVVTAALGASTSTSTITVNPLATNHLVINEVD